MRSRKLAVAALLFAALANGPAYAQDGALKNFIDRLISSSSAMLQAADAAPQCRAILAWAYDIPGLARAVAGDAWNKASAQERAAFQSAFEQSAISGCVKFAANERGALLAFAGTRSADNGDQLVAVRVNSSGRGERTWIWRIRGAGGAYRVTDVIVDGTSMLAAERRDVSQIITGEGSLTAATEYLRKRAAR